MNPTDVTWSFVLLEAVKILGPAAIAAIVSICVTRAQLQAKTTELQATARLRARELMFKSYQKHLEDVVESSSEAARACGKLLAVLASEPDATSRVQTMEDVRRALPAFRDVLIEDYAALERDEELTKHHDLEKRCLDAIREISAIDIKTIDPVEGVKKLMRSQSILGECEAELIQRMSKALFSEWL